MLSNQLQRTHKKAAESPPPPCFTLGGLIILDSWNALVTEVESIAGFANCELASIYPCRYASSCLNMLRAHYIRHIYTILGRYVIYILY